ncbi:MAG: DNA polymerase I [Lachnospira sp.]|nr:DNA polymerase I [Lachnospira sp.]
MSKKLILIDGHSILNRAFFGIPDLTNSEGIHTNAMYGFLNIMFKFIDEEKPDYITVAFDLSEPTFRHKAYEAYKGTRKPMAPELKQQVPLIKELLRMMNITVIEKAGYEADDIIGTIAKRSAAAGIDVSVISGDRDLLQLAEDKIQIRIPKTKKGVTEVENYYPEDVVALYGVTPLEFIDMKALMGDTSDNIPGAPGVGPKTASAIIQKYHSVDNVLAHLDELKPPKAQKSITENAEQVKMSRFLAEININVPLDYNIENAEIGDFYNPASYELFKKYNFKTMLKRFDKDMTAAPKADALKDIVVIQELGDSENIIKKACEVINNGGNLGLSIIHEEKCIYGLGICLSEKETYFIIKQGFITDEYLKDAVQKLGVLSDTNKKRQIRVFDLKEILWAFEKDGNLKISQDAFVDVSIASYLLKPNDENYEPEQIALQYLNITFPSKSELFGKAGVQEMLMTKLDELAEYACESAYVSLFSADLILKELENENMTELFANIEMPLVFVLYDMQKEGVRVDKEGLKSYGEVLGNRIQVLEKEIYDEAGEEFNINSPKQLGVILFEKMNMPYKKKTKSGYSTAADVLDKLAPEYPFVKKILEYRQLAKLKSTYADGLAAYISEDGRIHGKFNQTITATGRISSTEPNLQNIPIRMELGRQIRKVFIPKEGCVFLDADYSQIELRIMAHMSKDEKLIEAYNMAEDIHRITASQVFGVPFDEVTDLQRRNAKAVNFGIIYGISSFGLSQDLSISRKEASDYIEQYFKTYPKIKGYIDSMVEDAKKTGYSLTMFNRRRPIPELKSSNFMQRSFGERVAMNAPIQGTAADIIKLAMIRVYDALKKGGYKSKLLLQIHDELLVETYPDEIEDVKKIIEDGMKNAVKLSVPLEIDMKQGNNWLEAH